MTSHPPLPRLTSDPEEEFTGKEIRKLTAKVAAAKADAGAGQLFSDVSYVVISVLISIGLVFGIARALRGVVTPTEVQTTALDPHLIELLAALAVVSFAIGTAIRLGPVGVSTAGTRWWVPMPVDRSGLLTSSLWRVTCIWPVALAAVFAAVSAVMGASGSGIGIATGLGAACGLFVVALAGIVQPSPRLSDSIALTGDILVAVVPAAGLVVVTSLGTRTWAMPATQLATIAAIVLGVVGIALVVVWRSGLEKLGIQVLRARSGVADQAKGALMSMDTRELGRAMTRTSARSHRRRSWSFPQVRGPVTAVLAADSTLLLRTPTIIAQWIGLVCLLALGMRVPTLDKGFGLFALLLVVGFRAGQLGAAGARTAQMSPILDSIFPGSAKTIRLARCVLPALSGALALLLGTASVWHRWGSSWIVLVLVSGAVLGLAAIRSAYRKPADWSGPLIATPAGALPTGAASMISQGPDMAVLGCIPLGVALLAGHANSTMVLIQIVLAAIAVAVVSRVPKVGSKGFFTELMESEKYAEARKR